jgi:dihydroorotase
MNLMLIKNARVIDPFNSIDAVRDILINDGRISAVAEHIEASDSEIIDAAGLCAVPGFVDLHVHLRDPGQTYKEDILTGTAAAAAGGVTSLAAMPNTVPPCDNFQTIKYIADRAKEAFARVYPVACITKGMRGSENCDFDVLIKSGAAAFSDDGHPVTDDSLMLNAMRKAHLAGVPVLSHCEDLELAGGIMYKGKYSDKLKVKATPDAAEYNDVARKIALARSSGLPVHICHVSTAHSLELIRSAKRDGVPVTCESAPHYMMFTDADLMSRDADFRMNPPLGNHNDREAVIAAICDGTIDAIATDHAPHSAEEKSDFLSAPNGVIGMETSFSASYTALVESGKISFSHLIELMSCNPARILGIPAGNLSVGSNADIALIDPYEKWTVDEKWLHGKSKNTPFKGMILTGRVKRTILGGKTVFTDK